MATTAKELIEILQKYTDPDEIVIWQYYTRDDFDYVDNKPLSQKQFALVADKVEKYELWADVRDGITQEIWEHQRKGKN